MALQNSGAISLKQIAAEFGTAATLKSNYGQGGASASGDITIKEFYGRSAATDNVYIYTGTPGFHEYSPGYSIDQQTLTSYQEDGSPVIGAGFFLNYCGVYTTAGGDDLFGWDTESGLPTELGFWNYIAIRWGVGGFVEKYGLYEWYDQTIGPYTFCVTSGLSPSSVVDQQGYSLRDYVANDWGFEVQLDQRL